MTSSVQERAKVHGALGEVKRLAIVDELLRTDLSPVQLCQRLDMPSNLVAHHLDVLEDVGLVERFVSRGDRRRRYIRLIREPLDRLVPPVVDALGPVLFVCTQNSARSQLAAMMWADRMGGPVDSAGTEPAAQIHPGAVAAAARAGLDLTNTRPAPLDGTAIERATIVITVCDRANEDLCSPTGWWHWSTPDPVGIGTDDAFDATIADLDLRIASLR